MGVGALNPPVTTSHKNSLTNLVWDGLEKHPASPYGSPHFMLKFLIPNRNPDVWVTNFVPFSSSSYFPRLCLISTSMRQNAISGSHLASLLAIHTLFIYESPNLSLVSTRHVIERKSTEMFSLCNLLYCPLSESTIVSCCLLSTLSVVIWKYKGFSYF